MNQAQKNYTTRRINEIENEKIRALEAACTIPAVRLNNQAKYELIKSGKVALFPSRKFDANNYGSVEQFFDFSKFVRDMDMSKDFQERKEKIKAQAIKARDSVMLGDDQEALAAIQAFEKFKA